MATSTIHGRLDDTWTLTHPLPIWIDRDDAGYVVGDAVFCAYGNGATLDEALADYRASLAEYACLVRADAGRSVEAGRQYAHLRTYLKETP